ncbi:MAG: cupin domain-containing protein [Candidatus Omnitrophica bacterium]|nr:cupin domain-containing protein [Candidatus Omnitrophota bacterium]
MKSLQPILIKLQGCERFQRLLPGIPATAGMKSGYITLKPGEAVGEHKTEAKEESIIVLDGVADIYCEGKLLFTAREKSLIYIPPEVNHDIKNNSDKELRYVYVVSPVS